MFALDLLLTLVGLPVLAAALYLLVLAIAARKPRKKGEAPDRAEIRFDIIVPAHNEEAGIERTVKSLLAVDYPPALRRVLVVVDNCTDATQEKAEAAGAIVLVRKDPVLRGKGYALAHAFAQVVTDHFADVAVVIDADTTVSPNLLRAFASRFMRGASAAQASYGVQNPGASWRTRLLVIALALFHDLRSLGRERLGLSAGLRGNGMALHTATLTRVPYDAYSIVEDVEYGLRLGEAGIRIHYVPEAHVWGEMVSKGGASRSQRRRWEQGRRALARSRGLALMKAALRRRDRVLFDLATDVIVPPLATLALAVMVGLLASLARNGLGGPVWPIGPWAVSAFALFVYVIRGWAMSGAGLRGLLDLIVFAPVYVIWKLALSLRRADQPRGEWVRTPREARHGS